MSGPSPVYAELQVTSNYSFLRGASHPEELVFAAAALGHAAIAITDRNSLAGVVRAHAAAKKAGIRLVVGARLDLTDGPSLLCLPTDRAAYGRLARLLTVGKRRAVKGGCELGLTDVFAHGQGQIVVVLPPAKADPAFGDVLKMLKNYFKDKLYLSVNYLYSGADAQRIAGLAEVASQAGVRLVATNDAHAHTPARRPLQDVLTCIREHCTLREAGFRLAANAERHLKPPAEMARLFADHPDAVARTVEIAEACAFSLDELRYEYPIDPVPDGRTPQEELARLAWIGAAERFPEGVPAKVLGQIEHELTLIEQLGYAPYFLTVHDIVRFARGHGILCQGRGSAANSAVCYALGITAVDPSRVDLLFERFVSAERDEPPDIDVDFEHERREEVIQYLYAKYGRERAGMTATVITYRTKSALREVGKAMGLSEDSIVALQGATWRRDWEDIRPADIREAGLDPDERTVRLTLALAGELRGFPRHLSQHTGGMVMTKGPLCEAVPIANAAMADRTVIEWDKDDLDTLGMLKVDVLALGMLTCIRKAFDLVSRHHGRSLALATVPAEDPAVYDMLCEGDSVGVFQVESRAQMAMLPRLKPRNFYDLVIEVAIVRPGPIQGDMVHPYLRRRQGKEAVSYPSKDLEAVLGKTLGIPLFQEQAMKIAIVGAGFTPSEADALRRAMATFRRSGEIHLFEVRFIDGMVARGYGRDFAERCFRQIEGFADYGFPESHAASFALLVYVSAWLKRHYPAAFAAALLNSQPMGFYAPAQIVRDARDHGVTVRPVDVNLSDWDHALEDGDGAGHATLRLGLRQVGGFPAAAGKALVEARGAGYADVEDIHRRAGLVPAPLEALARADAFGSLGLNRRQALWAVRGLKGQAPLPLFAAAEARETAREPAVALPAMTAGESVTDDYRALRLSLKSHPAALLRDKLSAERYSPCARLKDLGHEASSRVAGLVVTRQRPGTASGVIFVTLEDETGIANVIVHAQVFERYRRTLLGAGLLGVVGRVQREGAVIHVLARQLVDLTSLLGRLTAEAGPSIRVESHDFH
ncbi:error-prone DNA polymerase [Shumkonia mesophila]|uniref:error-prone DNA polymerase n=1 Tax=Shumkonia mesophila TaxID=2838854 RepID=UPI00293495E8|nr:error-prone DNA polymerase [Shumkonia mesophila]